MGLNLYFFKKDINIQEVRNNISNLYEKLRTIQEEIEQAEDIYDDAKLADVNITHNLNKMADAVGLYEVLWKPDEIGITIVSQMIPFLEKGIKKLKENPEKYKAFNAPNGYGKYEDFVLFCDSVLHWCNKYPDSVIEANG